MRSTTLPMARAPSRRRTTFSPQLPAFSSAIATTMAAMVPEAASASATRSMARDITTGSAVVSRDAAATASDTTSMRRPSARK